MPIPTPSPKPTHLILVCCHAIYLHGPTNGTSEKEWFLASFQSGDTPAFIAHIQAGLRLLSSNPSALLVFSGSKTRPETQTSEAQSYLDLCFDNNFWGLLDSGKVKEDFLKNILLEEQALDSFGNLVFSIMRFWKETGNWPEKVTIVSHEFKRSRFMDLHVKALRWPREKVEFVGIDPGYMVVESEEFDAERTASVKKGEMERGFGAWEVDLRGVGKLLRGKRAARNTWGVIQVWFGSQEVRVRSGVRSKVMRGDDGVEEEVLENEKQPWEADRSTE